MAGRHSGPAPRVSMSRAKGGGDTGTTLLLRPQEHTPNSTQLVGFLTLFVSGGVLLFLTGVSLTTVLLAIVFFTPMILLTSPVWGPAGAVLFVVLGGFLSMCTVGIGTLAIATWTYKYMKGNHPPGSDRVDYARSRIAGTASHMKDYAQEYGGYLQSKMKDAAPGA